VGASSEPRLALKHEEILLIHLGGLGDVCLSESAFLSLSTHFRGAITALGYTRFLSLFEDYFAQVRSVEERRWVFLFSGQAPGLAWQTIILIGKDRSGEFRTRLTPLSCDPLIFIDMYPEGESMHVEEYQLHQLPIYGIKAQRKEVQPNPADRVILYPEHSRGKRKWPYNNFLALFEMLTSRGVDTILLEAPDVESSARDSLRFEQLQDTAAFLNRGGIFVSNDSGLAHLAATRGLTTITLFHDQRPHVWHPRGKNVSITCGLQPPGLEEVLQHILGNLEAHLPLSVIT
jgi:ADP-heptose:LPS heptosyltransferase